MWAWPCCSSVTAHPWNHGNLVLFFFAFLARLPTSHSSFFRLALTHAFFTLPLVSPRIILDATPVRGPAALARGLRARPAPLRREAVGGDDSDDAVPQRKRAKVAEDESAWEVLAVSMLEALREDPHAIFFNTPVDLEELPDYTEVVAQPMDFGTVMTKLRRRRYRTAQDLLQDVRLVFDNAYLYNSGNEE